VICGRAGFEWDMEVNEDTQRKELIKTGIKMKTESEFGFEPSLLVEMQREQSMESKISRRAIVLKDRFGLVDGNSVEFIKLSDANKEMDAVYKFFKLHIDALVQGGHAPIDTSIKSDLDVNEEGNADWQREKRDRTIYAEEIQGLLLKHYPSMSAADKAAKCDLLEMVFNTRSWTKIENMNSDTLKEGLALLRANLSSTPEPTLVEQPQDEVKKPRSKATKEAKKVKEAIGDYYDSKLKMKSPSPQEQILVTEALFTYHSLHKDEIKEVSAKNIFLDQNKFNLALYKTLDKNWPQNKDQVDTALTLIKIEDVLVDLEIDEVAK